VIYDSRAILVSRSMNAMPIATEDPWKVARCDFHRKSKHERSTDDGYYENTTKSTSSIKTFIQSLKGKSWIYMRDPVII